MLKRFRNMIFYRTNKRLFLIETMGVFLLSVSVIFSLFYVQTSRDFQNIQLSVVSNELSIADFQREFLMKDIDRIHNDLLFITKMKAFNDLVDNVQPNAIEGPRGRGNEDPIEFLQRDMGFYMRINNFYEEIDYADENGKEVFHIFRVDGELTRTPPDRLQNVSKKPHFFHTMELLKGEVYQTPMLKQTTVKIGTSTYRPRIKFATKVYDSMGEEKGVLSISYNALGLLRDFDKIAARSEGESYLLNAQGDILTGIRNGKSTASPMSDSKWAKLDRRADILYMIDSEESMVEYIEDFYEYLDEEEYDEEFEDYEGIEDYTYGINESTISYASQVFFDWGLATAVEISNDMSYESGSQWYAVTIVPRSKSDVFTSDSMLKLVVFEFVLYWPYAIPLLLLSWGGATIIAYRRKYISEITEMAQIDSMTGAFNRNAGISMLESNLQYAVTWNRNFSVCFVDVNDLKKVNDELGHEQGDAYLIDSVNVIKQGFREADHVIRLGGDEFLIGIQSDESIVERNWSKVLESVEAFNSSTDKPYKISLSHGVASLKDIPNPSIDELIALADERMYKEKKIIKANRM